MAKTLPPKLGGQPPPPTGSTREPLSSPSLPAAKPVTTQPPADPKLQKKSLKEQDWSQKGYFDGDGLQGAEKVSQAPEQAPRRGRTLVIPAVQEHHQPPPEAQAKGAWSEAELPSTHDAQETRDPRGAQDPKDAKAAAAKQRALGANAMEGRITQKLAMQPPPLPGGAHPKGTLYEMLENAREPGVLYQEDDEDRRSRGEAVAEPENPELVEAVEECIQRLFGVRGIHHIGPGKNEHGEAVIVIAASAGFGEDSMRRVPAEVRGFKTLVALPFDVLPLKRGAR